MSISKEEFKKAADHVGVQGSDRLALWAWWLKAWKCATGFDEEKERQLFEAWATQRDFSLSRLGDGYYSNDITGWAWSSWLACAKSRATR